MDEFKLKLEKLLTNGELEYEPSQNKISLPLAYRLYKKMSAKLDFDAIKVCENILIDGHHRYVAAMAAKFDLVVFPSTKNHNQQTFKWSEVSFITTDYDDESKINYHNFNDAKRNGITVEAIEKILTS